MWELITDPTVEAKVSIRRGLHRMDTSKAHANRLGVARRRTARASSKIDANQRSNIAQSARIVFRRKCE